LKVGFLLPARRELGEAVRYYNAQQAGLGDEFRDETWTTIERIKHFPLAWQPLGGDIRRCQMRRFPYGIIYEPLLQLGEPGIVVIAVACLHREPELAFAGTKRIRETKTMKDEVLEELWNVKDELARESGYDIKVLLETLRAAQAASTRPTVNLYAEKQTAGGDAEDRVNFGQA